MLKICSHELPSRPAQTAVLSSIGLVRANQLGLLLRPKFLGADCTLAAIRSLAVYITERSCIASRLYPGLKHVVPDSVMRTSPHQELLRVSECDLARYLGVKRNLDPPCGVKRPRTCA